MSTNDAAPKESATEKKAAPSEAKPIQYKDGKPYFPHLERKRTIRKRIIIGAVCATVLCVGIYGLISYIESQNTGSVYDSNAFFLVTEGGSRDCTLYSKTGEKLVESSFAGCSEMIGGYALVVNDEGQYGIINDAGKMSVEFGKYKTIRPAGGLYIAQKEKDSKYNLIRGNGKKIVSYAEDDIELYSSAYATTDGYVQVKVKEKYNIYNLSGELISSSSVKAGMTENGGSDGVVLISYEDGTQRLEDKRTQKKIYSFKSDKNYEISGYLDDKSQIVLSARSYLDNYYAIYTNNSIHEGYEECDSVEISGRLNNNRIPHLTCYTDGAYLIDNDGNVTDVDYYAERTYPIDGSHYAKKDEADDGTYRIYVNGQEKKVLSGVESLEAYRDSYSVVTEEKKMQLLDNEGNELFSKIISGGSIYLFDLKGIDVNGNIIYTDGNIYNSASTYVMNTSGTKLSDIYSYIYAVNNGMGIYEGINDDVSTLFNTNNKKTDAKYSSFDYVKGQDIIVAYIKGSSKCDIINSNLDVVFSIDSDDYTIEDGYLEVYNDSKVEYYTFNGVKIYEADSVFSAE